jgi:DNA-binding transcriptional regulator LsrR (DeoR family)
MKWNELDEGKAYAFGFLIIDVYQSSSYGGSDKQRISKFLEKFVEREVEKYGGQKWGWALDGGECGFLGECDPMVQAAEDILIQLNRERRKHNIVEFNIRICLHFGTAKWAKESQNIAGDELSWICKVAKAIGARDAIIITDDAYGLVTNQKLKKKFSLHTEFTREDGKVIKTYKYDPLSTTNLVEIAERYCERNESLDEIALRYNLTEHQIECLLDTAETRKIIEKKVYVRRPRVLDLEKQIEKAFDHLKIVRVVNYRGQYVKEEIAKIAADEVRNLGIAPGSSIAISCGTTIMEMAKKLEANPGNIRKVRIYPLLITMTAEMEEVSPAGIVSFLTRVFPDSKGYAAQFPREEENVEKAEQRKQMYLNDCDFLLQGARRTRYMFTGLGRIGGKDVTHSFNTLVEKLGLVEILKDELKAVGEFCYQPFTIDGELLMDRPELGRLRANIIYISLKELQEKVEKARSGKESIDILAIAGGKEKHESILGGLRARVFNRLITDVETAEYIVKNR